MKSKLILSIVLLSIFVTVSQAQYISSITKPDSTVAIVSDTNDISVRYANTILSSEMEKHLYTLASDEYEGRETGEKGNDMAAEYISNHLRTLGLPATGLENSYYQPVAFTFTSWENTEMEINGERFRHLWDYLSFPNKNENMPELISEEVVFLGYGIDDKKYSDYKRNKVKGKTIMIYKGEPLKKDSTSWVTRSSEMSDWTIDKKLKTAKEKGVKLVLIIEDDIKAMLNDNRRILLGGQMDLGDMSKDEIEYANSAYISTTMAKAIIGEKLKKVTKSRNRSAKKGKACDVKLPADVTFVQDKKQKVLLGNNIMAYIEGTDKKEELVVVSAHYDHLGKRGDDVYNGADDNGSGTTTVLEIAEALAIAKAEGNGPRRSVLCLWVTGEEKGLLGSDYYSENPVYPLENTVANVNIDMVGRVDPVYENNPNYIYVIGSDRLSTDLHKINEEMNAKYSQMTLDYTYNSEEDPNRYYFRSDHYNFAKKGIPAIFFFNGTHPDYHKITDTPDKINYPKMQNIGRMIFHTIWELANRDERIVVDGVVK